MASLVDTLIVKLLVEGAEQLTDAEIAVRLLAASQEKATASANKMKGATAGLASEDERTTKAKRTTIDSVVKWIASMDKASAVALKFMNDEDRLRRVEQDHGDTLGLLGKARELVTQKMQQGLAALDKTIQATEQYDSAASEAAEHIREFGVEVERLTAKFSPLTVAQKANAATMEEIGRALTYGAISQKEHAVAVAQTTLAYEKQVIALHAAANAALDSFTAEPINHIKEYNLEIEALVQKYDKVGVAAAKFAEVEREVNMVVSAGKLDQEQATKAMADAAATRDRASGISAPAAKVSAFKPETVGPAIAKLNADLAQLTAKYDDVYEAELKLQAVQKETNHLMSLGAGNAEQMAAALREATKARDDAAARARGDPVIGPDADAHIKGYLTEVERLRLAYDPLYAASLKNAEAIREINYAFTTGAISTARWITELDKAKQANDELVRSINQAEAPKPPPPPADTHIAEYNKFIEQQREKYVPLIALEKEHERELRAIAALQQAGGFKTAAEHTAALTSETQRYDAALRKLSSSIEFVNGKVQQATKGSGQLNAAVTNLGFQLNDIATGLASGQSPFTILVQQGGQVIQAFAQGGGVAKTLAAFKESLVSMITPTRLAIAALVAVGVAIAGIASHAASEMQTIKEYNNILKGLGETGQVTGQQLNDAAKHLRDTGSTLAQAQKDIQTVLQAGISGSAIAKVTELGRDIGTTLGGDGVQTLITAIKGGVPAMVELALRLHAISAEEAELAEKQAKLGDGTKAMGAIFDRINQQEGGRFHDSLSKWALATTALSAAWGKLLDQLSKTDFILGVVKAIQGLVVGLADLLKGIQSLEANRLFGILIGAAVAGVGGFMMGGPLGALAGILGGGALGGWMGSKGTPSAQLPPQNPVYGAEGTALKGLQELVAQIIQIESRGVPTATSKAGAQGLMQIMPATAAGEGLTEPFNAQANVETGSKIIQRLLKKYNNLEQALWAYNAGEGAVDSFLAGRRKSLPAETTQFAKDVMAAEPNEAAKKFSTFAKLTDGSSGINLTNPADAERVKKAVDDILRARKETAEVDKEIGASAAMRQAFLDAEKQNLDQGITGEAAKKNLVDAVLRAREKGVIELQKENVIQDRATISTKEIAAAYERGGLAVAEVTAQTQAAAQVTATLGGLVDKTAETEKRRQNILKEMYAQESLQNAQDKRAQKDTQENLKAEIGLQGQTSEEIQFQLTILKEKQNIEEKFPLLSQKEKDARLETVKATALLTKELQDAQREQGRLDQLIIGIGNTIDTAIGGQLEKALSGEKLDDWGSLFKKTLAQIQMQIIEMALIKPAIGSVMGLLGFNTPAQQFGSLTSGLGMLSGGGGILGGALGGGGEAPRQEIRDSSGNLTGTISSVGGLARGGGGLLGELGLGGSSSTGGGVFSSAGTFGGIGDFFRGGAGGIFGHTTTLQELFPSVAAADLPAYASAAGNANILSGGAATSGSLFGSTTLGSAIGGIGLGFTAGGLLNSFAGGNQTGGTFGSAGGAIAGTLLGSLVGMPFLGGLIGGAGGGLLGGMFGQNKKPDQASGGVINLGTGQISNVQSSGNAQNDATAQQIGQTLASAVSRALKIPGAQLPGGAVSVQAGSRDGIKLSYGGQEYKFGDASSAIAAGLIAIRDHLTGVSDTVKQVLNSLSDPAQIEDALAFADAYEKLKTAADGAFSSVENGSQQAGPFEQAMNNITATFAALTEQTNKYGLSLDPVNAALAEATKRLNEDFAKAVGVAFNASTGKDFLNTIQTLYDNYKSMTREASAVGATDRATGDKLGTIFNNQLKAAFAQLTSGQLDDVIAQFGDLANDLPTLAKTARDAAKAVEDLNYEMTRQAAAYNIQQDYDNAANQGFLSQLRDLDKGRIEAQKSAKALNLGDDRQGVIQETEHRAALNIMQGLTNEQLELARRTLAELNPAFAAWVDEVKAMTQATKDQVDAQARAVQIAQAQANIQKYLNSLQTTTSPFTSGRGRLDAAQTQYNAMLTKAQGGDVEALQGITQAAQTLLENVSDYYASSAPGQAIFKQVQDQLTGLLGPAGAGTATGATTSDVVAAVTATGENTTSAIGSSAADMVNASISASTAITTNAIQQSAAIMDAARTANDNIVTATINSGVTMTNATLASTAQIVGGTAVSIGDQTTQLLTGTGTVVTSTAATTTAVVTAGMDAAAAAGAILANNVTNAALLIGSNTQNAIDTIAANENNANLLRDASMLQTNAYVASNVTSAETINSRATAEADKLIAANDSHTASLLAQSQTVTDQSVAAANSNTSAIMAQNDINTISSLAGLAAGTSLITTTASEKSDALLAQTAADAAAAMATSVANTSALTAKHDQQIAANTAALATTTGTLDAGQKASTGQIIANASAATDRAVANQQVTSAQIAAQATADSSNIIANQATTSAAATAQAAVNSSAVIANQAATGANIVAQAGANAGNIVANQQSTAQLVAAQATAGSNQIVQTTAQTSNAAMAQAAATSAALAASASADTQAIIGSMSAWGTASISSMASWFQASINSGAGLSNAVIAVISNTGAATMNSMAAWGNATVVAINAGFGSSMNSAAIWGSAVQNAINVGVGNLLSSVGVWGSTINSSIVSWFTVLNGTVARYGEATITAMSGNATYLANYISTYGQGTTNSVNSASNYLAGILIDKFGWLVGTVAAWGNNVYTQISTWSQGVINQVSGSTGWLNDRQNERGNGLNGVVANWSQAIVNTIATWGRSTVDGANAGFNSVVAATGKITAQATVDAILGASTNQIGANWSNANWIVGTINTNGNNNTATIAANANTVIAAVTGGANSIIGVIGPNTRWIVDTINSHNVTGWLENVYNAVNAVNGNEVAWSQNLWNIIVNLRDTLNNQLERLYGEIVFQGNYLQYLTEITVEYDQWMAHMTQAQADAIAAVRDNLRKQAFG